MEAYLASSSQLPDHLLHVRVFLVAHRDVGLVHECCHH